MHGCASDGSAVKVHNGPHCGCFIGWSVGLRLDVMNAILSARQAKDGEGEFPPAWIVGRQWQRPLVARLSVQPAALAVDWSAGCCLKSGCGRVVHGLCGLGVYSIVGSVYKYSETNGPGVTSAGKHGGV